MNSIEIHLKNIRKSVLINDGKSFAWKAYSAILFCIFSTILLEGLLYLSTEIRFGLWQLSLLLVCIIIFGGIVYIILAINNRIMRYKKTTLARVAGKIAFPKEDTIINALQLEKGLSGSSSQDLSKSFINDTMKKMETLSESDFFSSEHHEKWKFISLTILIIGFVLFSFNLEISSQAVFRWFHPRTEFPAPKPFTIHSETGNINLLGGDSVTVYFSVTGTEPDSLLISLVSFTDNDSIKPIISIKKDSTGLYHFTLENVSQNYSYRAFVPAAHFWEAWDEITSPYYSISVTDRPVMEDLTITIYPPDYTQLKPEIQHGNQANIAGLLGSKIEIRLLSNRPIKKGSLIVNEITHPLNLHGKRADGTIQLTEEGFMSIRLEDTRGISNRNPIPFHLQVIPDLYPSISVLSPESITELGREQILPIHLQIEDDFGFSNLQVAYEIHRPDYIDAEPLLSLFSIDVEPRNLNQDIVFQWQLGELGLMPEDEVHFHFELSDNNLISGPQKTVSGDFIARLPGLAELFTHFEKGEENILDDIHNSQEEIESLIESFGKLELDILKQDNLNWDQQQDLKNILDKTQEELDQLKQLSESLAALQENADKHDLFTPDLLEKFSKLQELIDEILSPELMQKMKSLEEILQEMDFRKMKDALNNLTENMSQVEQELDRFIDIFERIKAEQKIDELQTRLNQLIKQQETLNEQMEDESAPSDFARLSEEEQRQVEEFSNIRNELENAAEVVEPFSFETAVRLKDLKQDPLMNHTFSDLQQAANQLKKNQSQESSDFGQSAMKNLLQFQDQLKSIQQEFQNSTTREMAEKFQNVMIDVLTLSKRQEELNNEINIMSQNSPRLGTKAGDQQMLQDQLRQIMGRLMELSKETFAITPEIGKSIGMSFAMMEDAKTALAQRNWKGASKQQQSAMKSLNEATMAIHQSMKKMQSSGSASGYEQFLKRMQEMAGQQQGINNQGQQLALGQISAAMQQKWHQRLLNEQKQVRKSLQEMMNEMQQSGKEGLGDLSGMGKEMDEVIKDFERKQFSTKTVDRQKRILSRMLDSQKSMTQRGEKEERKSTAGTVVFSTGPAGLPQDLGQRRSLTMEAMSRALKAGYSPDYQTMIRRYFNTISENRVFISRTDSSRVDFEN